MGSAGTADRGDEGSSFLWVAAFPLAVFLLFVWGITQHPLPWEFEIAWVPSMGVSAAFRIDGLSGKMLALITGIGTWVFVYASGYLSHEPRRSRLFLALLLFMLAMIGAVTADNLIVLFLFWELTSITSFMLVGFNHDDNHARAAARQALLVTMGGGLALLGGLVLLGQMAGTWSLSGIVAAGPTLAADPRLSYALLLVLLGAFTKSAQFPFHFWLPDAMSAPTPVSAYLHSATMVKLGIYLMARLDPAFNALLLWEVLLIGTGSFTALLGAVLALRERDLKRILAYSTVSALGTLTLLIGLPSAGAGLAVSAFLVAHALYKAPLFMVVGNIDHATGTRVIDRLMGLRRAMPLTAAAAVLAGLSMAGLPLSFGFVAKDVMSVAKVEADVFALVSYVTVLVNAVAIAVAGVAAVRVFWGPLKALPGAVREVPWRMYLPPLALVLLGIEFEFFPAIADPLLIDAARSIAPQLGPVDLDATYDLNIVRSATGITAIIGFLFFLLWDRLHQAVSGLYRLDRYGPAALYEYLLHGLAHAAAWQNRLLQCGRLSSYLRVTLVAFLAMGAGSWALTDARMALHFDWPSHAWAWLVACLLMGTGACAAVRLQGRLAVLMASGLVGYGSATLFLFAGAPDLAFTQFAVETVLVVVAASVLPRYGPILEQREPWNVSNIALASAAGIGTFFLLAHMAALPVNPQLADWFGEYSLSDARGRNVVNVIIVDFRALDTLGEIAVVVFALLAALPLFACLHKPRRS